jgi:chromosome partitioning protein
MRIWAFVSQKGGSGKTTLATQLAAYAEQRGETVLLIDIDPQESACHWRIARGSNEPNVVGALPEMLTQMAEAAGPLGVTLTIIDTAPHSDKGALAAIRLAELVVMPVRPALFDTAALLDTIRLLEMVEPRPQAVAVINGVPAKGEARANDAEAAIRNLGLDVSPVRIGHRVPFMDATDLGKSVTEIAPKDRAAVEIRELWDHLNALTRAAATPKAVKKPVKRRA